MQLRKLPSSKWRKQQKWKHFTANHRSSLSKTEYTLWIKLNLIWRKPNLGKHMLKPEIFKWQKYDKVKKCANVKEKVYESKKVYK